MELLRQLKRETRTLDEEAFERAHEGFYLLGQVPVEEDDPLYGRPLREGAIPPGRSASAGLEGAAPRHDTAPRPTILLAPAAPKDPARVRTTFVLWKVEKAGRNTWRRRISVGRADENDIVIRHFSVSKIHAHFHGGTLVRMSPLHAAELLLSDAGSRNGTVVGGRRLLSGEAEPLFSGTRILFGDVVCELLSAAALYTRLQGLVV